MTKNIYLLLSFFLFIFCSHTSQAADYFWIGGSGNWSDISHWSTTSGGAVTYPVVPSPNDRVIFDANSFTGPNQTVMVLVDNIFCMDMDWTAATNNPTFVVPTSSRLHVHGSLMLTPNMTWNHAGDLLFRSTMLGQTITTENHSLANTIYFSGQGGEWILQDNFTVDSLIYLEEGSLDLGSSQVSAKYLDASEATTTFNLNMNSAYITITGTTFLTNDFLEVSYPPIKLRGDRNNFTPGTATIELTQPNAEIWSEGSATISLPKLFFSAPNGTAYIGAKDIFGFESETGFDNINITNLIFASNALIRSEGNVDTLSLSPGKSYSLNAGNTYTIQSIQASGTCIAPITLSSTDGNLPVNLTATTGNISVDFLNLRGMNASGSATFTNNEGADLGGNNGWTFNTMAAMDLFWVGENGDWNDAANWSFSSGGPGGACLPNGNTNVFFDSNSFTAPGQVVNVNVDQISCLDIDWSGVSNSPTFQTLNSTILSVFGSFTLDQSVTWNHLGITQFLGNLTGNTITMAGQQMQGNVAFDGAGGEWILQDSFRVFDDIYLNNGHLNSNNQYIETHRLLSNTENPRQLSLGSSTLSFRAGKENIFQALTNNLIIDAGTSEIITNDFNAYLNFNQANQVDLYHFTATGFLNIYSPRGNQTDLTIQRLTALQDAIFTRLRADTLILTSNHSYRLYQEDTVSVGNIQANANCSGYILLTTEYPFLTNYLTSENDQTLSRLIIEDIHITGAGSWTANQSTDLGNTDGWIFPDNNERTLFWVGDAGDWADPNNWSLSSGGPGGECIPTPNDNVIFDENSFTTVNAAVFSSRQSIFFKDMDWRNSTNNPRLDVGTTYCYGSFYLSPDMADANFGYLQLLGNGDHEFAPHDFTWSRTEIRSSGIYRFLTDFKPGLESRMIIRSAEIFTNGFDWTLGELSLESPNPDALHIYHFEDSKIEITGSPFNQPSLGINFEVNATISPNTAEFEISGTGLSVQIDGIFPINKLFFSATGGTNNLRTSFNNIDVGRFGNITFNSSANLEGPIQTDSLILAAGSVFQFSNNFPMEVTNYLQALGNNCLPISLQSRSSGFQATIEMPASAVIRADFVQMQDHNATGGADFFAGDFSSDISNNSGWTFGTPSPNTQNGFLGSDALFCDDQSSLTLNASFNTSGETYLWQDGSTAATFAAPGIGIYNVEVTFPAAANCVIRDTIEILAAPNFSIDLPTDTTLCTGETLLLDATSSLVGVSYLWQDSSQNATFTTDSSGLYKVELSFEQCVKTDSTQVSFRDTPDVDLGADVQLCADENINLTSNVVADMLLWSDGSTGASLFVDQPGIYWLEASNDRCVDRDSVMVSFADAIGAILGPDQDLCQGANLTLNININNATFLWQDGSTLDSLVINQGGSYSVTAQIGNCEVSDTILITELPQPIFDLGPDQAVCSGETAILDGTSTIQGATYQWEDGSNAPIRIVSSSGTYVLSASLNGCSFQDSINITFNPRPMVDLGPDRTLCEGEVSSLDATSPGATYQWNDNSTNATLSVNTSGTYHVTVTLGSCIAEDTININFNPLPIFSLGPDQSLCEGEVAQLDGTNMLPGVTYRWEEGSINPIRDISSTGTYQLEATLNNCIFTDTINVQFNPAPNVDLGPDQTLCEGETSLLNASNSGATYLWSNGSTDSTLEVSTQGTYQVTVTLGTCIAADTIEVNFNPIPVFDLGSDQAICEGEVATLNGSSSLTAVTYIWQDGNSDSVRMVNSAGTYILEASLNDCFFADTINVIINPIPVVDLGSAQSLCEGDSITLSAMNPGASFTWNDGSTRSTLKAGSSGSYSVEVNLNNCIASDTVELMFSPLPSFDLGMDQEDCLGNSIQLDGTSSLSGVQYQWSDDGGNTNPIRRIEESGTYILRARAGVCLFEDEVNINFIDLGQLSLGPDQTLCEGTTRTLSPNTNATAFLWQDGSTNNNLTVNTGGLYWVEISEGSCTNRDSIQIDLIPAPSVSLGPDQTLCVGETTTLDAGNSGDFYFWQNGSTNNTLTVTTSGTYSVEVESNGCTGSDEVQVNFDTPFPLNLGPDISQCSDLSLTLRVPSGTTGAWVWSDGSTGSTLPITENGTYWLELNGACTARDSITVELVECVRFRYFAPNAFSPNNDGINDEFQIFFPDGILISDFNLQVYDRWGGLLFNTQDPDALWDGRKRNELMPNGIYMWKMQLTYEDDFRTKTIREGGEVIIMR